MLKIKELRWHQRPLKNQEQEMLWDLQLVVVFRSGKTPRFFRERILGTRPMSYIVKPADDEELLEQSNWVVNMLCSQSTFVGKRC